MSHPTPSLISSRRNASPLFKPTSTRDTATYQGIIQHRSSPIAIAVDQLLEHEERHGPEAVPPQDLFASWLEENKERFIEARIAARKRSRSYNARTFRATAPSPSSQGRESPLEPQGLQGLGRKPSGRRQICGIRKGICNLLSRAGAAVYPSNREEREQLDVFEEYISRQKHPHESHRGDTADSQSQVDQEENEAVIPINDEPGPAPQTPRRAERKSYIDPFDDIHPEAGNTAPGTDTPSDPPQSEATPPPPGRHGFHISQVAHLAPTYIAAERSRAAHFRTNNRSLFGTSTSSNMSTRGKNIVPHTQKQFRSSHGSSQGSTRDSNALRARVRAAGLLSGEVWVDGLEESVDERVGVRFVARPLGRGAGLVSAVGKGVGRVRGLGG